MKPGDHRWIHILSIIHRQNQITNFELAHIFSYFDSILQDEDLGLGWKASCGLNNTYILFPTGTNTRLALSGASGDGGNIEGGSQSHDDKTAQNYDTFYLHC